MTIRQYIEWNPGPAALLEIQRAETICAEYLNQGYDLTLRQLYYQFVARGFIPNNLRSYKRIGDIVNNARLSGRLSWRYIVDRTRNLQGNSHWTSPESIIDSAAQSYAIDKWRDQETRIEVWVEKEALAGVVGRVAAERDVDYFSCRGYVSQSELWGAAQRHERYLGRGQDVVVLHLGDHDPSGIDMTRDIRDRLHLFLDGDGYNPNRVQVVRIALNMDQIEQYNPPPNPAKLTDSRASSYVEEYGDDSWELDALPPDVLASLINAGIDEHVDAELYQARADREDRERELLTATSERWADVVELIGVPE